MEFAFTSIGSPVTKKNYIRKLKQFFDYVALPGNTLEEQGQAFLEKAKTENNNNNPYWAEDIILNFIEFQKQQIAPSTVCSLFWPVKAFCEAHERDLQLTINWKRLSRTLPETQSYSSNDRMPTVEEIRKLVEYPDRRIKPLVYVMCSTGIRLGAWQYLQWKHVKSITNNEKEGEKIIAARLMVYPGCKEQYYTFMTPEAFQALQEWMDYRALQGEKITGESWLMRDMWRTIDVKGRSWKKGEGVGLATHPKKLGYAGMKKILNRALWAQGLRNALPEGVNRHEVKEAHGYRKFFKTRAEDAGMKTLNVEFLMGHNNGLQRSYYKPTEKEVLNDYLKAVPSLTINDYDQTALKKQVAELTEKSEEENFIIKGKLAEKEKEIEALARKAEEADIMKKEIVELRTYVNEKQKEAYEREDSIEKRMNLLMEMDDKQQDAMYKEHMKLMRDDLEQLRWEMKREMNRNVKKILSEVITAREKRLTEYDLEEKEQEQKEK